MTSAPPTVSADDDFALQLALEHGLLPAAALEAARAQIAVGTEPGGEGRPLLEVLFEQGQLNRPRLAELIAREFAMPLAPDLSRLPIAAETLALVPGAWAARHQVLPLARENGRLRVAISNPFAVDALDALGAQVQMPIEPVLANEEEISAALTRCYGRQVGTRDEFSRPAGPADAPGGLDPAGVTSLASAEAPVTEADAPLIQRVHDLITAAIHRRASDIHLEPLERRFRVRYRIDGVLVEVDDPPAALRLAIISRLKIMANLSIAEKRLPQDGRIALHVDGRQFDLRVSSLPTAHGESLVMRILDPAGLPPGLAELGFQPEDATTFKGLLALPDGLVLVTGPTGSGKTTTLYACLNFLNQPGRKIITVEDPVEYQLSGVNQVPVRHDVGMTFASALRAMLRQAPNIVMVGEIRDFETAEIAIHASLTGHLVFSTLHTNDAPGAVTRLIDLGVKPFLVSSALRAAVAQRLVRRICPECRRPCQPEAWEIRALGLAPELPTAFARGAGCAACHATGFHGRLGLFELFGTGGEIQRMIHERAGAAALRARARALGMRTLREDGARKAAAGLTTVAEVLSLTVGDPS